MAEERIVDARGLRCPAPVILVKKALAESAPGDRLVVLLDDATACANVARFLADHGAPAADSGGGRMPGAPPDPANADGTLRLVATVAAPTAFRDPAEYCAPAPPARGYVLVVSRDGMGQGADDLARLLLQSALNTIGEVDPSPSAVVFYNAGVKMAAEGSPVLPALAALEARGVRLLVCGTCLNYFDLKEKLRAGKVSNMLEILALLAGAGHTVSL